MSMLRPTQPDADRQVEADRRSPPRPAGMPRWAWLLMGAGVAVIVGVAVVVGVLLARSGTTTVVTQRPDPANERPAVQPPADPQPTFAPDDTPPPSLEGLTSLDPTEVVTTHYAYYVWLMRHPQQAVEGDLGRNIWHPDCWCADFRALLSDYAEKGRWWSDTGDLVVRDVELLEVPGGSSNDPSVTGVMVVRVVLERTSTGKLIDSTGYVWETTPEETIVEEMVFVRGSETDPGLGEPWLLRSTSEGDAHEDTNA